MAEAVLMERVAGGAGNLTGRWEGGAGSWRSMNQPGEGRRMWMLEMRRNGRRTSLMHDGQDGFI